jgi:protein-S-isoprenylcysteine O-methyltransferase Ste14
MSLKSASMAGFLVLAGAALTLVRLGAILAAGPAGIAAQIAAVLLMLWARLTFGLRSFHATANPTEGGLVTNGPYRFVRHPIYAAILLFLTAGVLSHLSPAIIVLWLVAVAGVAVRIAAEERLVTERYPEYRDYAARTKRLIPYVV